MVKMAPHLTRQSPLLRAVVTTLLVVSFAATENFAVAGDADALVKEGIGLRRAGKDGAALKKFEEANAIEHSARTLAQIGLAEQALGRWGSSDRHLRAALAETENPWISKNRKSLEQALKVIGEHAGQLDIVGSPAGSEVLVDGEVLGKLPLGGPVAATAGVVAIEVRAPGYISVVRSAQIVVGGLTRESFDLQSASSPSVQPQAAATRSRRDPASSRASADSATTASAGDAVVVAEGQPPGAQVPERSPAAADDQAGRGNMPAIRIVTLVAAGLSVGAAVFGVVEHLKWQDRVSTFGKNPTCDLGVAEHGSTACQSLYDEGQSARTLAFVGYGAAGALAATAVVLFLVGSDSSSSPSSTVACGNGPGAWGLSCGARF